MTPPAPSGRVRVMIVDDHALLRSAVRQAITAPDIEIVAETATAEAALRIAPQVRPDLMLVDIDLPGMDGIRLVRELAPRLPETRIAMLTVSATDRDLVEAIRAGASGYLTKDLAPEALLRAVRGMLDGELAMDLRMANRLVRHLVESPRGGQSGEGDPDLATLSSREVEVLRLLAEGLTDREIAAALTISPRTVETHVSSILHKLRAKNRSDAARRYRERT